MRCARWSLLTLLLFCVGLPLSVHTLSLRHVNASVHTTRSHNLHHPHPHLTHAHHRASAALNGSLSAKIAHKTTTTVATATAVTGGNHSEADALLREAHFSEKYCLAPALSPNLSAALPPSLSHPFFFFHIPKTGGTSLRDFLFLHHFLPQLRPALQSTEEYTALSHMRDNGVLAPCYNTDCVTNLTLHVNQSSCARVFLGHFYPFEVFSELHRIRLGVHTLTTPPPVHNTHTDTHNDTHNDTHSAHNAHSDTHKITHNNTQNNTHTTQNNTHNDVALSQLPGDHTNSSSHSTERATPSESDYLPACEHWSNIYTQGLLSSRSQRKHYTQTLRERDLATNDSLFWETLQHTSCAVVLRNPFTRAVSGYYEFGYPVTNETVSQHIARHGVLSFLKLSSSEINAQTAILGGEPRTIARNVSEKAWHAAKRVLAHCVVGVQEDMSSFVHMVSLALRIPVEKRAALRAMNTFESKPLPAHVVAQREREALDRTRLQELIAPYLSLDLRLWKYARDVLIPRQKQLLFAKHTHTHKRVHAQQQEQQH